MLEQAQIEGHASRVNLSVAAFEAEILGDSREIVAAVSGKLVAGLSTTGGVVDSTVKNFAMIRRTEGLFNDVLARSNYRLTVDRFISGMVSQFDEFSSLYSQMSSRLPKLDLSQNDLSIISIQAGSTLAAIEAQIFRANIDLRSVLSRFPMSLGVEDLVSSVSDSLWKISKVGPIAKDQLNIFFRLVGNFAYSRLDPSIKFRYVGPHQTNSRSFCKGTIKAGALSRSQIQELSNGQTPDTFIGAGGFGCSHWWEAIV